MKSRRELTRDVLMEHMLFCYLEDGCFLTAGDLASDLSKDGLPCTTEEVKAYLETMRAEGDLSCYAQNPPVYAPSRTILRRLLKKAMEEASA